jgi:hypothetical protein
MFWLSHRIAFYLPERLDDLAALDAGTVQGTALMADLWRPNTGIYPASVAT